MEKNNPSHPTRNRSKAPVKKSQTQWSESDDSRLSHLVSGGDVNWDIVSKEFPGKTAQQVADRWNKVLNPSLVKGSWTPSEDDMIVRWVHENGPKNWSALAQKLPGRLGKQCRERWVNSLDPDLLKKPWTEEDETALCQMFDSGATRRELCGHFKRTSGAIASRLVQLGRLRDREDFFAT